MAQEIVGTAVASGGSGGRGPFGDLAPGLALASGAELAVPLGSIDPAASIAAPTGVSELDRVLGGGLVPGSVTLLGGEPGVGKSTLVLQVLARYAERGSTSLLIAAEESGEQVRRRAERLGAAVDDCYLLATVDLDAVHAATVQVEPSVLVVDSIQAVADPACPSPAGSPTQVRECAQRLVRLAKTRGIATVLVGHVTKDGALAGPRALEHLVDTVLSFDGDRHHSLRLLSSSKHRYGSTGELGLFEMREDGLRALDDPSALVLGDRQRNVAGSVAVPILEGRRPITVEIQGLVGPPSAGAPRRVAQGVTPGRLALLLAVLERRCGVGLAGSDVFVSAVGGLRATEPAADLGVALAVLSAFEGRVVPEDLVVIGEVGLAGELRQVAGMERRIAEATRLGFRRAIGAQFGSRPPDVVVAPQSRYPLGGGGSAEEHGRRLRTPTTTRADGGPKLSASTGLWIDSRLVPRALREEFSIVRCRGQGRLPPPWGRGRRAPRDARSLRREARVPGAAARLRRPDAHGAGGQHR